MGVIQGQTRARRRGEDAPSEINRNSGSGHRFRRRSAHGQPRRLPVPGPSSAPLEPGLSARVARPLQHVALEPGPVHPHREHDLEPGRLQPRPLHGQEQPRDPLRDGRRAVLHVRGSHRRPEQQHLRQLQHQHHRCQRHRLVDGRAVPLHGDDGPAALVDRLRLLSRGEVRLGHGRGRGRPPR